MDPLLHLCATCLLCEDEVRAFAKQVAACSDLSHPNVKSVEIIQAVY